MPIFSELRLVLTTPEKTLLDEPVRAVRLPLFDGQIGILPGRTPLVGRLGAGELKVTLAGGAEQSYFVDGGFVQVKGPVVSVLTNRAIPAAQIDPADADRQLALAAARVPHTDTEFAAKQREQDRARQMAALGRRAR